MGRISACADVVLCKSVLEGGALGRGGGRGREPELVCVPELVSSEGFHLNG